MIRPLQYREEQKDAEGSSSLTCWAPVPYDFPLTQYTATGKCMLHVLCRMKREDCPSWAVLTAIMLLITDDMWYWDGIYPEPDSHGRTQLG